MSGVQTRDAAADSRVKVEVPPAESADLQVAARILWQELRDVWGHVSVRTEQGFLLATVRDAGASVLALDHDGSAQDPVARPPVEVPIHAEVYRLHRDVNAVVHAHPHAAVALSSAGRSVRAVTQQSVIFGAGVPLVRGDFVDSTPLGAEIAAALHDQVALQQRGHGAVCTGPSLGAAVTTMLYLEQTAQQMLWAEPLGGAASLPQELWLHPLHQAGPGDVLWRRLVAELREQRP